VTDAVAVLVPVYKPELSALEAYSLDLSLQRIAGRTVFFIAPADLRRSYYEERYPCVPFVFFDPVFFADIKGYNRLLMAEGFYQRFGDHEYMLILQPDAVLLRDEIDEWAAKPYDYVGAPWPEGHELKINLDRFEGRYGKHVKAKVGNGGLSLRRNRACIALLREFPHAVKVFTLAGSNEDLFFSLMGALSTGFVVPNEIAASLFSMELGPAEYFQMNGGVLPMGGHAWWKHDVGFWKPLLPPSPLLDGLG